MKNIDYKTYLPTPTGTIWCYLGGDWAAVYDIETGKLVYEGHDDNVHEWFMDRLGYSQSWEYEGVFDESGRKACKTVVEMDERLADREEKKRRIADAEATKAALEGEIERLRGEL